jgi:hypothetical protein
MTGFFDDTAVSGTHVVLKVTDADVDPNGSTRTLTVAYSAHRFDHRRRDAAREYEASARTRT